MAIVKRMRPCRRNCPNSTGEGCQAIQELNASWDRQEGEVIRAAPDVVKGLTIMRREEAIRNKIGQAAREADCPNFPKS